MRKKVYDMRKLNWNRVLYRNGNKAFVIIEGVDKMSAAEASRKPSLTEGPIAKTLFLFSLPMLFGNVIQSLNGTINSIWVGKFLGEAALTAASNGNIIMFFLISAIFGVTMAATIMIGQKIGAGDVAETKRIVGTSAVFFLVLALAVGIIGFLDLHGFFVC